MDSQGHGPRRSRREERELAKLRAVQAPPLWSQIEERSNRTSVSAFDDGSPSGVRRVIIAAAVFVLFAGVTVPLWRAYNHAGDPGRIPASPDSGQHVAMPSGLDGTDGAVTLRATTNLPEGAKLSVTSIPVDGGLGGDVYCCSVVTDGVVEARIVNATCYYDDAARSTAFSITLALDGAPRGCDGGDCSPGEQPPSVATAFGSDLSGLSGEQVVVDDAGQKHLFATAHYAWPATGCESSGSDPVAALFSPEECLQASQLRAPDVGRAVSALVSKLGQGRLCDLWSHLTTDELRASATWDSFRADWLGWLRALSNRELSLRGDQEGELNSIGFGVSENGADHYAFTLTTGGSLELAIGELVALPNGAWGLESLTPCPIMGSGRC
jgi:hypothetical protein